MPSNFTPPPNFANGDVTITAEEFSSGKVTTKSINVGLLRYTITLQGARLNKSGSGLGFDRNRLKIQVSVQPLAGDNNQRRAPSKY